jgi:hypothetical protein
MSASHGFANRIAPLREYNRRFRTGYGRVADFAGSRWEIWRSRQMLALSLSQAGDANVYKLRIYCPKARHNAQTNGRVILGNDRVE